MTLVSSAPGGEFLFAYGANLNPAQIEARCSRPVAVAVARLPHHRIAFFGYSRVWDGAQETVEYAPGHDLWGVVYRLSFLDRERLDVWQDARLDGSGTYFHYPVVVNAVDGARYPVVMYKKDLLGESRLPSCEYRDFIAAGAERHGLPPDYCAELHGLEAVPSAYPVPRQKNFGRIIDVFTDCSMCGSE